MTGTIALSFWKSFSAVHCVFLHWRAKAPPLRSAGPDLTHSFGHIFMQRHHHHQQDSLHNSAVKRSVKGLQHCAPHTTRRAAAGASLIVLRAAYSGTSGDASRPRQSRERTLRHEKTSRHRSLSGKPRSLRTSWPVEERTLEPVRVVTRVERAPSEVNLASRPLGQRQSVGALTGPSRNFDLRYPLQYR